MFLFKFFSLPCFSGRELGGRTGRRESAPGEGTAAPSSLSESPTGKREYTTRVNPSEKTGFTMRITRLVSSLKVSSSLKIPTFRILWIVPGPTKEYRYRQLTSPLAEGQKSPAKQKNKAIC